MKPLTLSLKLGPRISESEIPGWQRHIIALKDTQPGHPIRRSLAFFCTSKTSLWQVGSWWVSKLRCSRKCHRPVKLGGWVLPKTWHFFWNLYILHHMSVLPCFHEMNTWLWTSWNSPSPQPKIFPGDYRQKTVESEHFNEQKHITMFSVSRLGNIWKYKIIHSLVKYISLQTALFRANPCESQSEPFRVNLFLMKILCSEQPTASTWWTIVHQSGL